MRAARPPVLVLIALIALSAACDSAGQSSAVPATVSATPSTTKPAIADGLIQSARFSDFYFGTATSGEPRLSCPQPTATVDYFTTVGELANVREWVELPLTELAEALRHGRDDPKDRRLSLTDPEYVDGIEELATVFLWQGRSTGSDQWQFDPAFATLVEDLSGSRALVALEGAGRAGIGHIDKVVVEMPDGGVTVIDQCYSLRLAARLDQYTASLSASSAYEVMREMASDPEALEAFARWAS